MRQDDVAEFISDFLNYNKWVLHERFSFVQHPFFIFFVVASCVRWCALFQRELCRARASQARGRSRGR